MVERIIEFCARNRFIVLLFVLGFSFMGYIALKNTRMDALPDISDTQVIVYTTWMGRSPDLMEDQVTYPIVTALLSAPKVVAVRGFSDFGFSYVYIIFEDGTDIYWARSRVLEYMSQLAGKLPEGVTPQLGLMRHLWAGFINTPWWMTMASITWLSYAHFRIGICAIG